MNPLIEGLLLPSKLALRTLDDFHRLAVSADRLTRFIDDIPPGLIERGFDDLNTIARVAPSLATGRGNLRRSSSLSTKMCSCMRVVPRRSVATGPRTVSTVVTLVMRLPA